MPDVDVFFPSVFFSLDLLILFDLSISYANEEAWSNQPANKYTTTVL